jgi:hypothetical protein
MDVEENQPGSLQGSQRFHDHQSEASFTRLIPTILPRVPEIRDDQIDPGGSIFVGQTMEGPEFKE